MHKQSPSDWLMRSENDSNGIRNYNHLVRKRTLNHLAKLVKNGRDGPVWLNG